MLTFVIFCRSGSTRVGPTDIPDICVLVRQKDDAKRVIRLLAAMATPNFHEFSRVF